MAGLAIECPKAEVSVVVVSDYAAGETKSWDHLRRALGQWAAQEGPPADEFLLVEAARFQDQVPPDLLAMVPNLRVLFVDADSSYELKNRAVEAARCEWVAIVDADCTPRANWLRVLRANIARQPDVAVFSSRTTYAGRSRTERVLALLSRSYLDPGMRGATRFISGNAACYRRDVYLRHPLPLQLGAFAGRIQSESLHRAGEVMLFDPALHVEHEFEGWPMELDLRRNHGYSTIVTRLRDERLPHARLVRFGIAAIPFVVAGKTIDSIRVAWRCYRHYGVQWWDLPLALGLIGVTHLMEIPGMVAAYHGEPTPGDTAWR
jgi:hypothetical protein